MGGHIDCYLDTSSFYSYMTLCYLLKNRDLLRSHDVVVDFHPIFLGGVNVGSGNKPPWTLPAKRDYGVYETERAKKYHNLTNISTPSFFPPLTLLPQRALCFIKSRYPQATFESTFLALFSAMWTTSSHVNITIPSELSSALTSTGLFTSSQVEEILTAAGEKEWKDKLLANTQKVLDQGAFGAPWLWVRRDDGKEEPFFGSDRFHFMWDFLGLPWKDIEILPKGNGVGGTSKITGKPRL